MIPKVLALSVLFMLMSLAMMASHFRGGTITWTRVTGRTVTFTVVHSWRTGNGFAQTLNFGDGTSASDNAVLVSSSGGYDTWRGTVTRTFASDGPFTAFFSGCCRISNLQNAADDSYRVETIVCLSGGNNNSPVTSVPAVIQMAATGQTVQLGATDADGNPVRFVFSTLTQSAISPGPKPPAGFTLSNSGALTYNGLQGYTNGMLFAIQITVNELGACGALVVADFIVEIGGTSVSNQPPVCTLNGPTNSTTSPGTAFSFSLTGTDPNGGVLTVTNSGLPAGATLTPTSGAAPLNLTFNWTPTLAQGGQSYPISVTFTDPQGATSFCTFTVTVLVGCVPPVITCPANVTVNAAAGQCGANVSYPNATATGTSPVFNYSQASGSFFPVGTQVVTVTATNGCGSSTCTFSVTVVDAQAPTINCPANITVNNAAGLCSATVNYSVTGSDNCPGSAVTQIAGSPSGASFPVGTTSNTFRNTAANGQTANCTFTVTVVDAEAPTITCPANMSVNNTAGLCSGIAAYSVASGDNCPGSALAQTAGGASGSAFAVGTTTNTFTVTAANGQTASCSFDVTVVDNEAPSITCPANISVNNDAGSCSAVVNDSVSSGDNCPGSTLAQTAGGASGSAFAVGTTSNTFTVTAANGQAASCSFDVTVVDNEAPSITCPANVSVNNDAGFCSAVVSYSVSSGDNCPGSTLAQTAGGASGSAFAVGTTTNSFTVTAANGQAAACSFDVTVVDNEAPSITCPANISLNNDAGSCSAVASYSVSGSDNCAGSSVSQSAGGPSGSAFAVGTTTNTFTVTAANGQTASCSFDVTVVDNEAPVIDCNASGIITSPNSFLNDVTLNNDLGLCSAVFTYTNDVSDNCPGFTEVQTAGLASGSAFPVGTTTNTFVVTDASGNSTVCSFNVIVDDIEAPTVSCPGPISVNNDAGLCSAIVSYSVSSGDNCPGFSTVQTAGLASGSAFPAGTTTNTFVVTDASNNSASCSFDVTVADAAAPSITCPANISVNNDAGQCGAAVSYSASATDNCAVSGISYSPASGSFFATGTTTVTATATDGSNNSASCTFDVTVGDNESPVITCPANIVVSGCGGAVSYAATATDNCQLAGISYSPASGSNFAVGTTTVTATATDNAGNAAACTFTVTTNTPPMSVTVTSPVDGCGYNVTHCCDIGGNGSHHGSEGSRNHGSGGHGSHHSRSFTHGDFGDLGDVNYATEKRGGDSLHRNGDLDGLVGYSTEKRGGDSLHRSSSGGHCNLGGGHVHHGGNGSLGHVGSGHLGSGSGSHGSIHVHHGSNGSMGSGHGSNGSAPNNPCGHDGMASASVSGGCGPFTYLWSNGATTPSIANLTPGTYTVTVTDAYGNTAVQSITLTTAAPLALVVTSTNVTCHGAHNGTASAVPSGGCGPFFYNWNTGSHSQTLTGLGAGNYCVTITDNYGCRRTGCASVTQPTRLVADAGANRVVYPAYAPQACATLTGSATGGNPAYSYSWTTASGLVLGTAANVTVCPTVNTVYYLNVTDSHGCTSRDSVAVCARVAGCGNNKVQICHRPPGMHSNPVTICVSLSAAAAHLGHGDNLGACNNQSACNFPHSNGSAGSGRGNSHSKSGSQAGGAEDGDAALLSLRAFPNPTNGSLQIELACMDCVEDGEYTLKVTDVFGRELMLSNVPMVRGEGTIRLDLGKFNAGVYMIVIEDGTHRIVERIVKQ